MKAIIIFSLLVPGISLAQPLETSAKPFDGFYLGVSVGSQNMFGGAHINELDLLAQKSSIVTEFSAGYRKAILNDRLVVGFELQLGITDGDLEEIYQPIQMQVFYKSNRQRGYGLILGATIGTDKRFLLYTYGKVTTRSFDISFTENDGTKHTQEDGQRFLQYGIGVELPIMKKLNIRGSIGGVEVDFGDLITSQDVEDKLDLNVGIVKRF